MSRKIEAALAAACDGYRERQALLKLLDARFPKTGGGIDAEIRALVDRLACLDRTGPCPCFLRHRLLAPSGDLSASWPSRARLLQEGLLAGLNSG